MSGLSQFEKGARKSLLPLGIFLVLLMILTLGVGINVQILAQETQGGVGIYLDFDPPGSGNLVVYSVTYKSPADKAKIKRGDQLVKVDGKEVAGKSLKEVAGMIVGPPGSTVTLTLVRNGASQDVMVVRQAMSSKPMVVLPPPSQIGQSRFLTKSEKDLVKQKIMGLKTPEQKKLMFDLLTAFQNKQISKPKFMKAIKTQFP